MEAAQLKIIENIKEETMNVKVESSGLVKWAKKGHPEPATKNADGSVEFEAAVGLTGLGKFHVLQFLACGLCLLSMIIVTLIPGYLIPSAQCDLQLTTASKGMLSASCFLGMIVSSHLWGFLADTRGRRKIIIITLLLDFLCGFLGSFSPTFEVLLVFRFFNGIFICGPGAVMYAYLGEFHTSSTRTRAIMFSGIFVALGVTCLPGLSWLVLPQSWSFQLPWFTYNSWRFFVVICSLPSLVTGMIFWLILPESPKFLLTIGQEEQALRVLRLMYTINTGKTADTYPVAALRLEGEPLSEVDLLVSGNLSSSGALETQGKVALVVAKMWAQTKPLFFAPYLASTILASVLDFGIFFCSNGLALWLPEIFNRVTEYANENPDHKLTVCEIIDSLMANRQQEDATLNETTGLTSTRECSNFVDPIVYQNTLIIGCATAAVFVVMGALINIMGKKNLLIMCLLIASAAGFGINFISSATHVLLLSCTFMGLSICCISVVNSAVVDLFPTQLRAMAVCISLMLGRVGTITGSLLVGILLEIQCTSMFYLLGGSVLGCGILGFFLPSPQKNAKADNNS